MSWLKCPNCGKWNPPANEACWQCKALLPGVSDDPEQTQPTPVQPADQMTDSVTVMNFVIDPHAAIATFERITSRSSTNPQNDGEIECQL